ncbi:MAG TPA: hypothetical protein VG917_00495 [Patescibacteria group bacterium]|nr:hypothetical protein [Patescibacteria group bacterium]
MKNLDQFKKDFKRDVLIRVIVNLEHGKTTRYGAKTLAKEILEIFAEEEAKKVFMKMNKLTETRPEILDIFIKRMSEYEAKDRDEKINQIMVILKAGGGQPFQSLAKGGETN